MMSTLNIQVHSDSLNNTKVLYQFITVDVDAYNMIIMIYN